MKFMVSWCVGTDQWLPVLKRWSSMTREQRADAGKGVKLIGRWHDVAARRGVAILESTDLPAVQGYLGQWNPVMDLDIAPVLDDEESAAVAKVVLANQGG